MTLYEQITDFVTLGYTFEFSPQPLNLNIKTKWRGIEKSSWLPYRDHCNEEKIVNTITWMTDQIQEEENSKPPTLRL